VKIIPLQTASGANQIESREIIYNPDLDGMDNVMSFSDAWVWHVNEEDEKCHVALVSKLYSCDFFDAYNHVLENDPGLLIPLMRLFVNDGLNGIRNLHDRSFAHKDIKMENCFVDAKRNTCSLDWD